MKYEFSICSAWQQRARYSSSFVSGIIDWKCLSAGNTWRQTNAKAFSFPSYETWYLHRTCKRNDTALSCHSLYWHIFHFVSLFFGIVAFVSCLLFNRANFTWIHSSSPNSSHKQHTHTRTQIILCCRIIVIVNAATNSQLLFTFVSLSLSLSLDGWYVDSFELQNE